MLSHHPVPKLYNLVSAFVVVTAVMDAVAGVPSDAYSPRSDIVVVSVAASVEKEMYMQVRE